MKKSVIIPLVLLVYLAVMSCIGWKGYASGQFSALYYFGLIALTLVCIWFLRLNLLKREKRKNDNK